MVVILVVLTLVVCLSIDYIRTRRAEAGEAPLRVHAAARSDTAILERYFHPGHTWAMLEGAGTVTMGVDDIARGFIGAPDAIEVVPTGTSVRQGEPIVKLRKGSRSLALVAPLSGVLTETNPDLQADPSILNNSPFERGWIAKIAPANLALELHNLLRGPLADKWRDGVRAQLAAWFAPRLGVVLQDGGQLVDNFSEHLSDSDWEELAASLFLVEPFERSTTHTREGQ